MAKATTTTKPPRTIPFGNTKAHLFSNDPLVYLSDSGMFIAPLPGGGNMTATSFGKLKENLRKSAKPVLLMSVSPYTSASAHVGVGTEEIVGWTANNKVFIKEHTYSSYAHEKYYEHNPEFIKAATALDKELETLEKKFKKEADKMIAVLRKKFNLKPVGFTRFRELQKKA